MEIDLPDVKKEVEAAFARYEKALLGNDVETLNELFFESEKTIRYGGAEILYGHRAISAFRSSRSPQGLGRTLSRTVITTYGRDFAVASTLFDRPSIAGRIGRQQQTWARMPDGWRIVAAHVSMMDEHNP